LAERAELSVDQPDRRARGWIDDGDDHVRERDVHAQPAARHLLTAEPMAQMVGFVVAYSLYGKLWGPIFRGALNALYPGSTYVSQ
jgi:hypothetical protein